jgi:hypothetical protein
VVLSFGPNDGHKAYRWRRGLLLDELVKILQDRCFRTCSGGVAQLVEQGTFNP